MHVEIINIKQKKKKEQVFFHEIEIFRKRVFIVENFSYVLLLSNFVLYRYF